MLAVADVPEFHEFYRVVNARDPFPWQQRLAELVERAGWPESIGVPTGLGKTSCIDIAVWALARQAKLAARERTAPTRTWYVVNRRLLVDTAFDHGSNLAALLADVDADPILRDVAAALESIRGGAGANPLHVTRLRGGAELGARPPDPSQPTLIFATVPMFASRWLFRGYGTSASMRPVDAALAGTDSLVLLDEAHLARPLMRLAGPLAQCDVGDPAKVVPERRSRPFFVSLTATGGSTAFNLDKDDHRDPLVKQRLDAPKRMNLVQCKEKKLVDVLVEEVVRLLGERSPSAAILFVNSPKTARAAFDRLRDKGVRKHGPGFDLELLTGRVRDREADTVRARLLDPFTGAPAGFRDRDGRTLHLVVVATQTLEVGADVDFDVLVTEACGARSLIQRLGRLNRLGDISDGAASLVYAEDVKEFGIYGDEPHEVFRRLSGSVESGVIQLNPRVVAEAVGSPADQPERVGELLPAHVWEWAKTTVAPQGEALPELFFSGLDRDLLRVSLVWRVVLPEDGSELVPAVSGREAVELPLWEARDALKELANGSVARLKPDKATVERDVTVDRLRPGDHVILQASIGGYDRYGWTPESRDPVFDLSLLRPPGIPLISEAFHQIAASGETLQEAWRLAGLLADPPQPDEDIDREELSRSLRDYLAAAGASQLVQPDEWDLFISSLLPRVEYPIDGPPRILLKAARRLWAEPDLRTEAFDELSFTATSQALDQHLGSVGEVSRRIAESVGLPAEIVEVLDMAGRFHDWGKADVRFQRWLDPTGLEPAPVAKSSRPWQFWQRDREAAGWPKGGRHEELSSRVLAEYLDGESVDVDEDLVLHLVASHHGHGRPLVLPVPDPEPTKLTVLTDGREIRVTGDLSVIDWDQPARFRRCCERYGYWGLALIEAILRQADHSVSSVVVV